MNIDSKAPDNADLPLRVKALEQLLIEKGMVDAAVLDYIVDAYQNKIGPRNGAKVVARAWVDPEFKARLLADGTSAMAEMGIGGFSAEHMVVVENTEAVHNVIVCTLCSCYPWGVLGLPPNWYKSFAYRSRLVREPRAVLREFGLALPDTVELRVWDSNSDLRYLVLPVRPRNSEQLSESQLAALVSRDAMIGTAVVNVSDVS